MRFHVASTGAAFILGVLLTRDVVGDIRLDDPNPNGWYSAYTKYPEYCSTPAMMAERTIPPLQQDPRLGETRLVHVTATLRHGARTPTEGGYTCWDGYWDDPATGVWDCDLKTQMAPPTPYHEKEEEGQDGNGFSDGVILFEKHYDAMMDPKNDLSNDLFGTCQTGQLLLQGYEQHTVNGQILRDAYVFDSKKYDHDVGMRLIDLNSKNSQPWTAPQLYIRSDDDSRVLLSGQILVRSLFETEIDEEIKKGKRVRIPVHLADKNRDVVGVNEQLCPRLTEMRESFERTSSFKSYNNSREAKKLRKFMKNELKAPDLATFDILGCLLPTICTDKLLPPAFDYENSDLFDRMMNFAYKKWNMHILANEAEYAKLAMAPIWAEIMDKIGPIVRGEKKGDDAIRFHVVSGHDDTISPMMASLGVWNDTAWPPYASMFLIEIHEIIDGQTDHKYFSSKFAFRLIYNGQVITNQVEGCLDDAELCDIKVFTNIVEKFATRERHCHVKHSGFLSGDGSFVQSPFYSFLLILAGGVLGGLAMSYYITGSVRVSKNKGSYDRGYDRGASSFVSDGDLSMPTGAYSDEPGPTSYQDGQNKNKNMGDPSFLD